jgi:hypothetical protein
MNPYNSNLQMNKLVDAWGDIEKTIEQLYSPAQVLARMCQLKNYRLLRVTAVLTSLADGSHAMGVEREGKVYAAEPVLRNPYKHKTPEEDWIKDWIRICNLQLLFSGADFGLDIDGLTYVLTNSVDEEFLSRRECNEGNPSNHEKTVQWLAKKALDPAPDNPFRDHVILLYRWGTDPITPAGQGCSSYQAPYLLLCRYPPLFAEYRFIDGRLIVGDCHLSHEFGHYLGIGHTHSYLADQISNLAVEGNPFRLPFIKENLPSMQNVTEQDIETRLIQMRDFIKTFPYNHDQDNSVPDNGPIPSQYAITDTPVDLGMGVPLLNGHLAGEGTHTYAFEAYNGSQLQVTVDDTTRGNMMGYWHWNPLEKKYSPQQVERMKYVLENLRPNVIGKTLSLPGGGITCWFVYGVPLIVKKSCPTWKLLQKIVLLPWTIVMKTIGRRHWEDAQAVTQALSAYQPWSVQDIRKYAKESAMEPIAVDRPMDRTSKTLFDPDGES